MVQNTMDTNYSLAGMVFANEEVEPATYNAMPMALTDESKIPLSRIEAESLVDEIESLKKAIEDLKHNTSREMLDIFFSFKGEAPTGAYPLWTGATISNCQAMYPDFWREINRLASAKKIPTLPNNTDYNNMVNTYGQCPCFVINQSNGSIRLPKITKFISSINGLGDLGKVFNDQVKRHSHTVSSIVSPTNPTGSTLFHRDGALVNPNSTLTTNEVGGEGYPKHVRLALYIQVVNNTVELSRLDVDALKNEYIRYLDGLQRNYNNYIVLLGDEYTRLVNRLSKEIVYYKYTDITVTKETFVSDNEFPAYPFSASIQVPEATTKLAPTVIFETKDAMSGEFSSVAMSGNGYVRIYAKKRPLQNILIKTIILQ